MQFNPPQNPGPGLLAPPGMWLQRGMMTIRALFPFLHAPLFREQLIKPIQVEILVAEGVYTSNNFDSVIVIEKSITLSGGWNTGFGSQIGSSTLDGQNARRGIRISNATSVNVSKFTVMNGQAYQGGGIQIYNSTVSLDNMSIYNNIALATSGGGGIENQGTMTIDHSLIFGNKAGYGGGIYGSSGSDTTINNSAIFSNTATFGGGGISGSQTLKINNTTISKNISEGTGGGISGTPILNNVTISENHAISYGGGISGEAL